MASELYEDQVGSSARRWPPAYDMVIGLRCLPVMGGCGAGVGDQCVNPITGRYRKMPCMGRHRSAGMPAPHAAENHVEQALAL